MIRLFFLIPFSARTSAPQDVGSHGTLFHQEEDFAGEVFFVCVISLSKASFRLI